MITLPLRQSLLGIAFRFAAPESIQFSHWDRFAPYPTLCSLTKNLLVSFLAFTYFLGILSSCVLDVNFPCFSICFSISSSIKLLYDMKIVRFAVGNNIGYGILDGMTIQCLLHEPYRELALADYSYNITDVRLLAPCTPSKIIALGLNYQPHADEMNQSLPKNPLIFLKPPTSVIGPEDNIVYPPTSNQVDYEGELAVIIKKPTWAVAEESAFEHIFGYTCFNDVTARDIQRLDQQWTRAKSFNTFAAVGPCIETDLDPHKLVIRTYLNGILKQKASTSELIFSIPELIHFISHVMTLLPGDIITTGTPSGVGPMYQGDTIEVTIDEIGSLRNFII